MLVAAHSFMTGAAAVFSTLARAGIVVAIATCQQQNGRNKK